MKILVAIDTDGMDTTVYGPFKTSKDLNDWLDHLEKLRPGSTEFFVEEEINSPEELTKEFTNVQR